MKETVVVRWRDWTGAGLEHLVLKEDEEGFIAEGVVAGETDETTERFGVFYRIRCDSSWSMREAEIAITGGNRLRLMRDGAGSWTDQEGKPLPEFDGAIDIDLSATPFTNTLPICRLGLLGGESREIPVLYVACPELTLSCVRQRYTCLDPGRLYRFESLESDFMREIEVDDRGLVVLYPGLFKRCDRSKGHAA